METLERKSRAENLVDPDPDRSKKLGSWKARKILEFKALGDETFDEIYDIYDLVLARE